MAREVRRVSVSLRRTDGRGSHFLAERDVDFYDGSPQPIDYAGRRYLYSHTTATGGYKTDLHPEVYVFDQSSDPSPDTDSPETKKVITF